MNPRRWMIMILLLSGLGVGSSLGQEPADPRAQEEQRDRIPPDLRHRSLPPSHSQVMDLRRRLIELDRLLSLGSLSRAESLLSELEQHTVLRRELGPRRIELAQLKGDHEEAARLCREALVEQSGNPALWRELAVSQLALDQPDSARMSLGRFITTNPNGRSAAMVSIEMLLQGGRPALAVALLDTMRLTLQEPRFMGRHRAVGLLAMGDQEEAADEVSSELRANPFNLALLRTELLQGPFMTGEHGEFLVRLRERAADPVARPAEGLLAANLLVDTGRIEEALDLVRPMTTDPHLMATVLQNSGILAREMDLLGDPVRLEHVTNYLLDVLPRLATLPGGDLVLRRRAADQLALVCESALAAGVLGADPNAAADRFGEMLDLVRQVNPTSEHLYTSQIKLAIFTRDQLGEPGVAARRLERLLLNLDLPTAGVALVRLTLGECFMAAGDTSRARTVLENLGRDPRFRREGGHAHYHLARLDLAQGHFGTARDRFAVVALDNPGAPYANESLRLGLAVAEEMDNPSGGPEILVLYAPAVYADLTRDRDGMRDALTAFVEQTAARVDMAEPQHLLERGRFELARIHADEGQMELALALLDRVVADHPDGRVAPQALEYRGTLLMAAGRAEDAGRAWERLLAQYPNYLFIDDVRDALRALP